MSEGFDNPAKSKPDVAKIKQEKKSKRKEERKQKRMKWYSVLVDILHATVSVLFFIAFFKLGIFPTKLSAIVFCVILLLFFITLLSQRGKKAGRVLGRIYAVIIMLILLCGTFALGTANYMLEQVTGAPLEKKEQEFDLMSGGGMATIMDESFSIYIKEKSEVSEAAEVFCVVHPQTRQMVTVTTPGTYYVTIPGVTNGQSDWISKAWEHGPEVALETLGNLYETKIDHYLEMDSAWVAEVKEMFKGGISYEEAEKLLSEVSTVKEHIRTSLSKYEVQQLIKGEFQTDKEWGKHTKIATGSVETRYTYSSPETRVPIMIPDKKQVDGIIDFINGIEEGEILETGFELPSIVIP